MGVLAFERLKGMIKEVKDIAMKQKNFVMSPITTEDAGNMPNLDSSFSSLRCKVLCGTSKGVAATIQNTNFKGNPLPRQRHTSSVLKGHAYTWTD